MNKGIIALLALVLLVIIGGAYYFTTTEDYQSDPLPEDEPVTEVPEDETPMPVEPDGGIGDGAGPLPEAGPTEVIGQSVEGNDITAYHFGEGETEVLFVGGIHGGYSFNTAALGFELVDYFEANSDVIPENVTVTVIPVVNPDGLESVVGTTEEFNPEAVTATEATRVAGRFNANQVDLNRNFDCEWSAQSTWQSRTVSGGDEPFSEPEAQALRDYVQSQEPAAVVTYYSQAGGVYSSTCNNGIDDTTADLTNIYAEAAGYPAFEEFDYYEINGDFVNWVASEGIPGISVLLTDHENIEWTKNRAGVLAVLSYFAQ